MAVTIWGSSSSWTLTALPLFVWMGEILFRTRLSEDMFRGLAPWLERVPGRLLHTNIIGCTIFAAVSGSSAATCATIGKMTLPELKSRGYPEAITIGSLAGAGTLGLLIPPSIIMIVYGVAADVSIAQLFIAGVIPGHAARAAVLRLHRRVGARAIRARSRRSRTTRRSRRSSRASRHLIPVDAADRRGAGLDLRRASPPRPRPRRSASSAALAVSATQGSLNRRTFVDSLMGATRLYCMIALILVGRRVPHAVDGLHRPAARPRRVDRLRSACRRSR